MTNKSQNVNAFHCLTSDFIPPHWGAQGKMDAEGLVARVSHVISKYETEQIVVKFCIVIVITV